MAAPSRIPHILPVRELVRLLLPTYAEASSVDDAEAQDRLERSLASAELRDDLHRAFERSLAQKRGPRTTEDQQLDRLSRGLAKHHVFKALPATPPVAAVMVAINLAAGLGEGLSAALATGKGRALYQRGLEEISGELVDELLR